MNRHLRARPEARPNCSDRAWPAESGAPMVSDRPAHQSGRVEVARRRCRGRRPLGSGIERPPASGPSIRDASPNGRISGPVVAGPKRASRGHRTVGSAWATGHRLFRGRSELEPTAEVELVRCSAHNGAGAAPDHGVPHRCREPDGIARLGTRRIVLAAIPLGRYTNGLGGRRLLWHRSCHPRALVRHPPASMPSPASPMIATTRRHLIVRPPSPTSA